MKYNLSEIPTGMVKIEELEQKSDIRGNSSESINSVISEFESQANKEEYTKDSIYHALGDDGKFTEEKRNEYFDIISKHLDGVEKSSEPTYYMLGGGSASGKSTMLASDVVNVPGKKEAVFVDSDAIKGMLPEYVNLVNAGDINAASYTHEESSMLAKMVQKTSMQNGYNVVLDGTGTNPEKHIQSAREYGMIVKGYYATVPIDTAIERATIRGMETGRVVKEDVIRATHVGASRAFERAHQLFDEVTVIDTRDTPIVIAKSINGELEIMDEALYKDFIDKK